MENGLHFETSGGSLLKLFLLSMLYSHIHLNTWSQIFSRQQHIYFVIFGRWLGSDFLNLWMVQMKEKTIGSGATIGSDISSVEISSV